MSITIHRWEKVLQTVNLCHIKSKCSEESSKFQANSKIIIIWELKTHGSEKHEVMKYKEQRN